MQVLQIPWGRKRKRRHKAGVLSLDTADWRLFRVSTTELVDAATGIDNFLLAGVERVRVARNIHLDQRIFIAIRPLHGFLAGHGRAGQKREVAGQILENDGFVFRMGIELHETVPFAGQTRKKRARL